MEDKVKVYNLQSWVFEHCYNLEDYIRAMKNCGFTEYEHWYDADKLVWNMLNNLR